MYLKRQVSTCKYDFIKIQAYLVKTGEKTTTPRMCHSTMCIIRGIGPFIYNYSFILFRNIFGTKENVLL